MSLARILTPVSYTENSLNGLRFAIHLARETNSELDIFHVEDTKENKNKIPHVDLFREGLDVRYKEIIRKGEVTEETIRITSELEPELILMSPDVFNKEKKYFEESVTGNIIKKSICPILMIPPKTEFRKIETIVLVTDMTENIIKAVQELLKIFENIKPKIDILIFPDKTPEWHFKKDVFDLIQKIKNYTEYINISGTVCEKTNNCIGLELCAEKTKADLICMESNVNIFYNLFLNCKSTSEIAYLKNKPILILPRYWEDSI